MITAVPPHFAIVGMQLVSWNSDRTKERIGLLIGVLRLAALGWALMVVLSVPGARLVGLVICAVGGYSAMVIFWTMGTKYIPRRTQAVGMAATQSVGNLVFITSPVIIGALWDSTHNFYAGAWYTATFPCIGILLTLGVTLGVGRAGLATTPNERATANNRRWPARVSARYHPALRFSRGGHEQTVHLRDSSRMQRDRRTLRHERSAESFQSW